MRVWAKRETEQAAIQRAIVRKEDEAFNRLPPEVRARINKEKADDDSQHGRETARKETEQ